MKLSRIFRSTPAFTLVEILAATTVLAVMFVIMFGILQQTARGWQGANRKVESTQAARLALEQMASDLENTVAVLRTNVSIPRGTGITNYAFGFAFLDGSTGFTADSLPSGGAVKPTTPNDSIFVVTPFSTSLNATAGGGDLCEVGYVPMFVGRATGYGNTWEGKYILVRSFPNTNNVPSSDFAANSSGWWLTPGVKYESQVSNFYPLIDNCLRFEIKFYWTNASGALLGPTNSWGRPTTNGTWQGNPVNVTGLPVAADITLSVLDERSADRLYRYPRFGGLTMLPPTILTNLPYNLKDISDEGLRRIFEEGLTTFQRRVYFKNSGASSP
jgi:type II secretory pathway pseudopilin PulG